MDQQEVKQKRDESKIKLKAAAAAANSGYEIPCVSYDDSVILKSAYQRTSRARQAINEIFVLVRKAKLEEQIGTVLEKWRSMLKSRSRRCIQHILENVQLFNQDVSDEECKLKFDLTTLVYEASTVEHLQPKEQVYFTFTRQEMSDSRA